MLSRVGAPRGAVQKLIASNKLPHLLFYGPPGTGKTSTILACAKKLYGADFKMMVLEVGLRAVVLSVHFVIAVLQWSRYIAV